MEEEDLAPDGAEAEIDAPVVEAAPPTVEALAADMGWKPKEGFHDPDKWKPAHEYLRNTVDVNRNLNSRLKSVDETLARVVRTSATLTEREVAKAREQALSERAEAVELGDTEAFNKAEAALNTLPQAEPPPPTAEGQDFTKRHASWWKVNPEATAFAMNRAEELGKLGLSPARQLSRVEAEMKDYFPELFPARAKAAPLNAPGNRGGQPAKKGYSSLPADVQAAALDYEKRSASWSNPVTREDYAKLFYEEGAGA